MIDDHSHAPLVSDAWHNFRHVVAPEGDSRGRARRNVLSLENVSVRRRRQRLLGQVVDHGRGGLCQANAVAKQRKFDRNIV